MASSRGAIPAEEEKDFSGNVQEESTGLRDEMEISLVLLTALYIQLCDWFVLYNWSSYFRLFRRMWGRLCYYLTQVSEEFFIDICLCLLERHFFLLQCTCDQGSIDRVVTQVFLRGLMYSYAIPPTDESSCVVA